jgi:hypothetical protein
MVADFAGERRMGISFAKNFDIVNTVSRAARIEISKREPMRERFGAAPRENFP